MKVELFPFQQQAIAQRVSWKTVRNSKRSLWQVIAIAFALLMEKRTVHCMVIALYGVVMIEAIIGLDDSSTVEHKRQGDLLNCKDSCTQMSPLINQTDCAFDNMTVGVCHPANSTIEQSQRRCRGYKFSIK